MYSNKCLFQSDVEVLTPAGWGSVSNITTNTKIAQITQLNAVEFVYPKTVTHSDYQGDLHYLSDLNGLFYCVLPSDNRIAYTDSIKTIWQEPISTFKVGHSAPSKTIPLVTFAYSDATPIPAYERMLIAYAIRGEIVSESDEFVAVKISLNENLRAEEESFLFGLTVDADFPFTMDRLFEKPEYIIQIPLKYKSLLLKNLEWLDYSTLSSLMCSQLSQEILVWCSRYAGTKLHFENEKIADAYRTLSVLSGVATIELGDSNVDALSFSHMNSSELKSGILPEVFSGSVTEIITSSRTMLIKQNNVIMIVGN